MKLGLNVLQPFRIKGKIIFRKEVLSGAVLKVQGQEGELHGGNQANVNMTWQGFLFH